MPADWLSRQRAEAAQRMAQQPLLHARCADRHDPGLRNPGRAGAGEQLQPGGAGPRPAGARWRPRRSPRACWAARASEIINAVSNAWIDGQALRTYRHAPNTGSRKSWAAGRRDQPRGAPGAAWRCKGEMGYPSALTARTWGFYDVLFKGQPLQAPAARSART